MLNFTFGEDATGIGCVCDPHPMREHCSIPLKGGGLQPAAPASMEAVAAQFEIYTIDFLKIVNITEENPVLPPFSDFSEISDNFQKAFICSAFL